MRPAEMLSTKAFGVVPVQQSANAIKNRACGALRQIREQAGPKQAVQVIAKIAAVYLTILKFHAAQCHDDKSPYQLPTAKKL